MGTTISTDWRLKFQREIIPTAVSQVRGGGPNDTGLSFKANVTVNVHGPDFTIL